MVMLRSEKITDFSAVKLAAYDGDKPVGRIYLYLLKNDLHKQPFGFLEDLFVEEPYRKQGIGSQLVRQAIAEAKNRGCYKLIANSRTFAGAIHKFYEKQGFAKWGFEFRMNL